MENLHINDTGHLQPSLLQLPDLCLVQVALILKQSSLDSTLSNYASTCQTLSGLCKEILFEKIELPQGVDVNTGFCDKGGSMELVKILRLCSRNSKEINLILKGHANLVDPQKSSSYPSGFQTWLKLSHFHNLTELYIEVEATPCSLPLLFFPSNDLAFPHLHTLSLTSSMREIHPALFTPDPPASVTTQFRVLRSFTFNGRYMVLRHLRDQLRGQSLASVVKIAIKVDGTQEGKGDELAKFAREFASGVEELELEFAYAAKPYDVYPIVDISPLHQLKKLRRLRLTFEQLNVSLTYSSLGRPHKYQPPPATSDTAVLTPGKKFAVTSEPLIQALIENLARENKALDRVEVELVEMDDTGWDVGKLQRAYGVRRSEGGKVEAIRE